MAPGNQPTGTKTASFDLPGAKAMTPTAFCVPLQTKSVLPDGANASAFGLAPNGSPGFWRAQIVSTIFSVRVSITLKVSLPALATTKYRPLGERAIAEACSPVSTSHLVCWISELGRAPACGLPGSITVTEPSLAT